jgi:hypothetical protein
VYSQEKLLRYALPFDGVPPDDRGRFCGDIRDGDVFTFTSISSSSSDSLVGMLSFRMFMSAADRWRQYGDWGYGGTTTSSNFEDDEAHSSCDCEEGQSFSMRMCIDLFHQVYSGVEPSALPMILEIRRK